MGFRGAVLRCFIHRTHYPPRHGANAPCAVKRARSLSAGSSDTRIKHVSVMRAVSPWMSVYYVNDSHLSIQMYAMFFYCPNYLIGFILRKCPPPKFMHLIVSVLCVCFGHPDVVCRIDRFVYSIRTDGSCRAGAVQRSGMVCPESAGLRVLRVGPAFGRGVCAVVNSEWIIRMRRRMRAAATGLRDGSQPGVRAVYSVTGADRAAGRIPVSRRFSAGS